MQKDPSGSSGGDGALRRVLSEVGSADLMDALVRRLSGADFTVLMLDVMRRRAALISPAQLMRHYSGDRFVAPGQLPFRTLRKAEELLLSTLPSEFQVLSLSPVTSLGTHSVVAGVDQNRVVSTIRGSEVAAYPTNGLALEAAVLRRKALKSDRRSPERVRLAALQRVVRGQQVQGPGRFAHFELLGLVTAGRDTGNLTFEREAAIEHAAFAANASLQAGAARVTIELTDLSGVEMSPVLTAIEQWFAGRPAVEVVRRPDRPLGRDYYHRFCFKVLAATDERRVEVADGGLVTWTQLLVGSKKERCFISGAGVERVAALAGIA